MNIKLHSGGVLKHTKKFQEWHGNEIMQTAIYAGEEMVAITDDKGGYELLYMGFTVEQPFSTMEDAKLHASQFANAVLNKLLSLLV